MKKIKQNKKKTTWYVICIQQILIECTNTCLIFTWNKGWFEN